MINEKEIKIKLAQLQAVVETYPQYEAAVLVIVNELLSELDKFKKEEEDYFNDVLRP